MSTPLLQTKLFIPPIRPEWVSRPRLLERAVPSETLPSQDALIEPLSERELEILHLIAEGLTNPEIAAKLGVHNRTQAAARARALGILSSTS